MVCTECGTTILQKGEKFKDTVPHFRYAESDGSHAVWDIQRIWISEITYTDFGFLTGCSSWPLLDPAEVKIPRPLGYTLRSGFFVTTNSLNFALVHADKLTS
jgi:hypothetical protein